MTFENPLFDLTEAEFEDLVLEIKSGSHAANDIAFGDLDRPFRIAGRTPKTEQWHDLMDAISAHGHIRHFALRKCELPFNNDPFSHAMAGFYLLISCRFSSLDLQGCRLDSPNSLFCAIGDSATIRHVNLNYLFAPICTSIIDVFRNKKIFTLKLARFFDVSAMHVFNGIFSFLEHLKWNESLKTLDLSGFPRDINVGEGFFEDGIKALAGALKNHRTLRTLHLGGIDYSSSIAKKLSKLFDGELLLTELKFDWKSDDVYYRLIRLKLKENRLKLKKEHEGLFLHYLSDIEVDQHPRFEPKVIGLIFSQAGLPARKLLVLEAEVKEFEREYEKKHSSCTIA